MNNLANKYRAYGNGSLLFWCFSTMDCNCNCHYCKVHDLKRPELTMSKHDWMEVHYWQQKYAATRDEWKMPLFMVTGGEPLMNWENWKEFYEVSPARKTIITNLVDLPNGFLPWLKAMKSGITPSCDGYHGKPDKNGNNTSPKVMANFLKLKEWEIPHSMQSVLNDETTTAEYLEFADWVIDYAGNNHWKTNIDSNIQDEATMKNKITTLKALIDHLHKRKVIISRPQHSVRNKNKLHFSVDFSGIDAVNTTTPGCLCGCGHNLFGLGKTSKGISLFRCNCTNEESMSLGLLSNFSESVMDYEYGYREKFRDYCVGCPLSNTCGGNCKCGENARGNKGRDFFCEGKIELINYLWTKYYSNGYPK